YGPAVEIDLVVQVAVVGKGEGLAEVLVLAEDRVAHVEGDVVNVEIAPGLKGYALFRKCIGQVQLTGDHPVELLLGDARGIEVSLQEEEPYGLGRGNDGVPDLVEKGQLLTRIVEEPL